MEAEAGTETETYNPWTVVNLVFTHLADQGLHPVLGESGDPQPAARALLAALGIEPAAEGNREVVRQVREHLAQLREVVFAEEAGGTSQGETSGPVEGAFHGSGRHGHIGRPPQTNEEC